MLQNLKKRQEGFTIIEVMIVLVIAAVILLIVFLAVPALQRNSRNTQANNEASAISAAVGEFVSNNNGTIPTGSTTPNYSTAMGSIQTLANVKTLSIDTTIPGGSVTYTATNKSTVYVKFGATCTTSGAVANFTAGTSRQLAVAFPVENTTTTPVAKCINSGV